MEVKIRGIIARQLGINVMKDYGEGTLSDDLELMDDLSMDSLDCVELTMSFEEEFGIEIPDEDAEDWKTVGDVVTYLKGKF